MNHSGTDRISPVFYAWYEAGKYQNRHSSDSYGERIVLHYEIEYIVESSSGYIITDGIPIQTIPQTVFFRFPGMIVEGIGAYHSLFVEFEQNELKEKPAFLETLPLVYHNLDDNFSNEEFFRSLNLPKYASNAEKLLWKAKMLQMLAHLILHKTEDPHLELQKRDEKRLLPIRKAIAYVRQHYAEKITLQDLADSAGYSSYYFCKLFKEVTKLTPMQYVVRYRIERAEKKLLISDSSAEAIMLETGFHNYGYFCRTFKQIYGLAPQDYRTFDQALPNAGLPSDTV